MILAIETSGTVCGAALHDGNAIVAVREDDRPRIHDAALTGQIRGVLEEGHIGWEQIDAVACSIGPGSFTGIRIGLSMAKGLCYSLGKKLVAVPTLDSLAFAARTAAHRAGANRIIAALAAESDKCYVCSYDLEGNRLEDYRTVRRNDITDPGTGALVIGTASLYFTGREIASEIGITLPRVQYIAELGSVLYARGTGNDPEHTDPLYVTSVVHTAN